MAMDRRRDLPRPSSRRELYLHLKLNLERQQSLISFSIPLLPTSRKLLSLSLSLSCIAFSFFGSCTKLTSFSLFAPFPTLPRFTLVSQHSLSPTKNVFQVVYILFPFLSPFLSSSGSRTRGSRQDRRPTRSRQSPLEDWHPAALPREGQSMLE